MLLEKPRRVGDRCGEPRDVRFAVQENGHALFVARLVELSVERMRVSVHGQHRKCVVQAAVRILPSPVDSRDAERNTAFLVNAPPDRPSSLVVRLKHFFSGNDAPLPHSPRGPKACQLVLQATVLR